MAKTKRCRLQLTDGDGEVENGGRESGGNGGAKKKSIVKRESVKPLPSQGGENREPVMEAKCCLGKLASLPIEKEKGSEAEEDR
ncbi:hypothetical protein LXL04_008304 [Taraxacum kok-saghyz]